MGESWNWLSAKESLINETPLISDLGIIKNQTCLKYPTLLFGAVFTGNELSCRGLIGVTKSFNVQSGGILRFSDDSDIHVLKSFSNLYAEEGSFLHIGENVTFSSEYDNAQIIILTENVTIDNSLNLIGNTWGDLLFGCQNQTLILEIEDLEAINGLINISIDQVRIENSRFNNSTIQLSSMTGTCVNSSFTNSSLLTNPFYSTEHINISSCTFTNYSNDGLDYEYYAIFMDGCERFDIEDCSISGYTVCGICATNVGNENVSPSVISNVTITDISNSGNNGSGILLYNSKVNIGSINNIYGNDFGIKSLNNSEVSILGNRHAGFVSQTQQIHDNDINQIYATYGAFPYEVRWNAIYDEDNNCLFLYDSQNEEPAHNVPYNFWGYNFDPQYDLCPTDLFSWTPVWNLQFDNPLVEESEQIFYASMVQADSGLYSQAQSGYQQVISTYPESKYATSSLKELFAIEQAAGNNYNLLKSYYNNIVAQQTDDELVKIADFLSNSCDIKLKNYENALSWYENVIQNPPSFADSIFAIIDLGYLYLKMEGDSLKSFPVGSMTEYKPASKEKQSKYRDYLLSLLNQKNEHATELQNFSNDEQRVAYFIANLPNPFADVTNIQYTLQEEGNIIIRIFNAVGKQIKIFDEGYKTVGIFNVLFIPENLSPGVYFCSIERNGVVTDSYKISMIN